jgi:hypothetical protein
LLPHVRGAGGGRGVRAEETHQLGGPKRGRGALYSAYPFRGDVHRGALGAVLTQRLRVLMQSTL